MIPEENSPTGEANPRFVAMVTANIDNTDQFDRWDIDEKKSSVQDAHSEIS